MRPKTPLRRGMMALALLLAACSTTPPGPLPTRPISPTPTLPGPVPVPVETAASAEVRAQYSQIQQALLAQGLLRTDPDPVDAPFTDRMLAENFLRIAFYDEFDRALGGTTRSEAPSPMQRWAVPVRVGLRFGASVPPDRRFTSSARRFTSAMSSCGTVKTSAIGCSWLMTANPFGSLARTMFPWSTSRKPIRPEIGATIRQYLSCSFTLSIIAS